MLTARTRAPEHLLQSARVQATVTVLALVAMALVHRAGDGLWFQGDSPRHAMNGVFWWDLLRAGPAHPIDYALRYYARYPALSPATYPPGFYLVEGAAFALLGIAGPVARGVVLLYAVGACAYTMAWARRWMAPAAGWAAALLAVAPTFVLWSNSVMLNIPALALTLGTLYHARRWIETARTRQLALAVGFAIASLGTYYQSAGALVICGLWIVMRQREIIARRHLAWMGILALCGFIPVIAALILAPVQALRHLPSVPYLLRLDTWTYYWRELPGITGWPLLALGTTGLAIGVAWREWRREAAYLLTWILVLVMLTPIVTARDPRYILLVLPAFVLAAVVGVVAVSRRYPITPAWRSTAVVTVAVASVMAGGRTRVPVVTGVREVAEFLKDQAPDDALFFDGDHSGVLVFYVRALDPAFQRRVVLASKLLYSVGPRATFGTVEQNNVRSPDEVIRLLRTRAGCRWIAFESATPGAEPAGRRLLREALSRPDFTLVRSFPMVGYGAQRIDLYRLEGRLDPVTGVDLEFPGYSSATYPQVVPITR